MAINFLKGLKGSVNQAAATTKPLYADPATLTNGDQYAQAQADFKIALDALNNLKGLKPTISDFGGGMRTNMGYKVGGRYVPKAVYEKLLADSQKKVNTLRDKVTALHTAGTPAPVVAPDHRPAPQTEPHPDFMWDVDVARGVGPSGSRITRQGPSMSDFLRANQERFVTARNNVNLNTGEHNDKSLSAGENTLDRALITQGGFTRKKNDGSATHELTLPGQMSKTAFRVSRALGPGGSFNQNNVNTFSTTPRPLAPAPAPHASAWGRAVAEKAANQLNPDNKLSGLSDAEKEEFYGIKSIY